MSIGKLAFVTPARAPRPMRWLLFSPLARIGWFAAAAIALGKAGYGIASIAGWTGSDASPVSQACADVLDELLPVLIAYIGLVVLLEMRVPGEFVRRPFAGLSAGLAAGLVLICAVAGTMWLLGSYHVLGRNPDVPLLYPFLRFGLCAALAEEILFRGVLFRICEEGLGTWFALLVSAAAFGAMHADNAGANLWSLTAIALELGVPLAMLYHLTRSLWPCVGLHAAWNTAQGVLFGIPVSGYRSDGFLVSDRSGPDWLGGGAFGAEASVVALSWCSICAIALILVALRRRSIVLPSWKREPARHDRMPILPADARHPPR